MEERHRDDIAATVAAYDNANPEARLRRNAVRLLTVMFPVENVCQRSLDELAREGFDRRAVSRLLHGLIEAGLLSKEQNAGRVANTYRLHLPTVPR